MPDVSLIQGHQITGFLKTSMVPPLKSDRFRHIDILLFLDGHLLCRSQNKDIKDFLL
jgi:hypothetical protein